MPSAVDQVAQSEAAQSETPAKPAKPAQLGHRVPYLVTIVDGGRHQHGDRGAEFGDGDSLATPRPFQKVR